MRRATLTTLLAVLLGTGCVGTANVVFDERVDLSKYQTWSWLPASGPNVELSHGNAAATSAKLARMIERKLFENGFQQVAGAPDFYISYYAALRIHEVTENEASAIRELSSHHASPSYVIEGSRRVTRRYSEIRLAITAIRPGERTLWSASFAQYEREFDAVKLGEAVATLLAQFPVRNSMSARVGQAGAGREMMESDTPPRG